MSFSYSFFFSLIAVGVLLFIALVGVEVLKLQFVFGVIIPYAAFLIFIGGMIYRVLKWSRSSVPFRIPTTGGQQKSLPWIKQNKIDNPSSFLGTTLRMAFEVLLFRSLFRHTKSEIVGGKLVHGSDKWLWAGALAFHYSFFMIVIRHLRLFTEPVLEPVSYLETMDAFFQIHVLGSPLLYLTDVIILGALGYLFLRRVWNPQLRYISLAADYFPLLLIMGIGVTGVLMRYFFKVDVVGIKELTMGWVNFAPKVPEGIGVLFYIHLFFVSVLLAYFPFSKLTHMAGVFLSPTRNLASDNRMKRHINPWDYPVKIHTYEEYEEEFREKMKKAGLPLEKE